MCVTVVIALRTVWVKVNLTDVVCNLFVVVGRLYVMPTVWAVQVFYVLLAERSIFQAHLSSYPIVHTLLP